MKPKVIAIGTFDGIHLGHRSVLKALADYAVANDHEPVVLTFDRHPLSLINPSRRPDELTPLHKKKNLLKEAGAMPMVIEFNEELRTTTARRMMQWLHDEENVRAIVIGYDNTFGSDGINLSLEDFRQIGKETGIEVITAPEIKGVSSSAIRKAVAAGDVEKAREMLGRPFSITGKVEKGNYLGHSIGYPTANLSPMEGVALPKPGVYAAIVKDLSDNKKYPAMVNIGTRPTMMRGNHTVIEAHLFDFKGDLYNKEITVRFLKRLRDEIKFPSIDALKEQLAEDSAEARKIATEFL